MTELLAHFLTVLVTVWALVRYLGSLERDLPKVILLGILGLLHGLVPLVASPGQLDHGFPSWAHEWSAVFALFGVTAVGFGFWIAEKVDPRRFRLHISVEDTIFRRVFWGTLILGFLGLAMYVASAGVSWSEYVAGSRFAFRHRMNVLLMWPGLYLTHLLFVPPFVGMQLGRRYRRVAILLALFLGFIFFVYIFPGTRHMALGVVMAAILGWHYSARNSRRAWLVLVTLVPIVLGAVVLYEVRKGLSSITVSEAMEVALSEEVLKGSLGRDPLNYHQHLTGAVASFPRKHDYLWGASYMRILMFPLPGAQFEAIKPPHPGRVFARVVYPDVYNFELQPVHPPSLLGDAYINFWGWPGLLILVVNGFVFAWVAHRVWHERMWRLTLGPHMGWFVLLAPRGSPYELTIMALFQIISIGGLTWLLRPRSLKRGSELATSARALKG